MKSQKIINFLDHKDEDDPRSEIRKWYIVNDHNNENYSQGDDVQSVVKFNTEIVKPFLCDYSDAFILVIGNIKVQNGNDATRVAVKNCHPFIRASIKLNNEQVDAADNLDLTMNLCNMLEYSDSYADTTGSLYQYKRPEPRDVNGNVGNLDTTLSPFKYQSGLVQKQLTTPNSENAPANTNFANAHRIWKNIKIAVPLKYISNFFRNLELPLINTKMYIELNWRKYSVLYNQDHNSIFQIAKGELYIPVVTLNTENNNKLSELLSKGFERTVVWNEYKSKTEDVTIPVNNDMSRRTVLDTSFQGVNELFAAVYETDDIKRIANTEESRRIYYLPRAEIKDYKVLIDERNFYDQTVNGSIVRYDELLKMTTGRSEDYITGCLLDYDYYIEDFNIVGIDLSQQPILDSDPKINQ